jgi:hypothetical protein
VICAYEQLKPVSIAILKTFIILRDRLVALEAFTELLHGVPNQPGGQQVQLRNYWQSYTYLV